MSVHANTTSFFFSSKYCIAGYFRRCKFSYNQFLEIFVCSIFAQWYMRIKHVVQYSNFRPFHFHMLGSHTKISTIQ